MFYFLHLLFNLGFYFSTARLISLGSIFCNIMTYFPTLHDTRVYLSPSPSIITTGQTKARPSKDYICDCHSFSLSIKKKAIFSSLFLWRKSLFKHLVAMS